MVKREWVLEFAPDDGSHVVVLGRYDDDRLAYRIEKLIGACITEGEVWVRRDNGAQEPS